MIKIKNEAQIEAMKEAGRLSAKALRIVGEMVEPGISTLELDQAAENVIRSEGGVPAFKGYDGFPGSICASVNDIIVHGIPSEDVVLHEGDIISIDTGAIVDGWVGDNAWTFPCGEISPDLEKLIDFGAQSLWAGIEQAKPGNHLGDIGHAVQTVAEGAGYKVVREYVGHGVGRSMHEDPLVPNYGVAGDGIELVEGMVLAIEPMLNMKSRRTKRCKDGWGVRTADKRPSVHVERTVAITSNGPLVLTKEE
ncbi:MAG: type I methionyl aminopeptidase [Coriobacteriales bacterium]